MKEGSPILVAVGVMVVAGGAWFVWKGMDEPEPAAPPPTPAPVVEAPPAPPPPAPDKPAIQHPIEDVEIDDGADGALPDLGDSDGYVVEALAALIGNKTVRRFVNADHFIRSFVATVDNLAREHAPLHLWPVKPTPGELRVTEAGNTATIAPF
jgi:hypothetical protein